MMDWSERGDIRKRGPLWDPSARIQLFAAERRTSHGSKKEETLRRSTEVPEKKQKKAPYNSQRPPEVFDILTEVFIVPW